MRSNQSIEQETGLKRRPDAAAVKNGKVIAVGEVARTQADGKTIVKREQIKQQEYKAAGIKKSTIKKIKGR